MDVCPHCAPARFLEDRQPPRRPDGRPSLATLAADVAGPVGLGVGADRSGRSIAVPSADPAAAVGPIRESWRSSGVLASLKTRGVESIFGLPGVARVLPGLDEAEPLDGTPDLWAQLCDALGADLTSWVSVLRRPGPDWTPIVHLLDRVGERHARRSALRSSPALDPAGSGGAAHGRRERPRPHHSGAGRPFDTAAFTGVVQQVLMKSMSAPVADWRLDADIVRQLSSVDAATDEDSYFDFLERQVGDTGLVSNDRLASLLGSDVPFARCHGDLVPWNVARAGSQLVVWDWEYSLGAPLGFDIVQSRYRAGRERGKTVPQALSDAGSRRSDPHLERLGLDGDVRRTVMAIHGLDAAMRIRAGVDIPGPPEPRSRCRRGGVGRAPRRRPLLANRSMPDRNGAPDDHRTHPAALGRPGRGGALAGGHPGRERASTPIDLDFVFEVARTWRRELLGAALAGLVLGVAVTMLAPTSYTGFAVVRVDPFVVDELGQVGRNSTGNTAGLEAEARSDTVMELAGSMLEPAVSAGELRPTVQAVRVGTGNVVELEATASSAERAADKANAVANAFLEVRRTGIEAELAASVAALDTQIEQAEAELTALRVGGDGGAESSVRITSLEERLQTLNALRVRADLYSALPGEVLRAATPPEQGDGASPVVMGLALAVLAATAVLAFGVIRQRPLVTVTDVAALAGPVVATLRTGDGDESSYILGVRRVDAWLRVRARCVPSSCPAGGRTRPAPSSAT